MRRAFVLRAAVITWVAVLSACASAPPASSRPGAAQLPPEFPAAFYERATPQAGPVYRVDTGTSLITFTVRRGGSLARLGHDHVIASRAVQGYAAPAQNRADLFVPLNELTVDEPSLRAEAGLDTQPTASDIEGTRANMLGKVLQVQDFPHALVGVRGQAVTITLHGTTRTSTVAVQLAATADGMRATGTMELKPSDFGIAPLSLLGGALQVKDEIEVRFDIRMKPWAG